MGFFKYYFHKEGVDKRKRISMKLNFNKFNFIAICDDVKNFSSLVIAPLKQQAFWKVEKFSPEVVHIRMEIPHDEKGGETVCFFHFAFLSSNSSGAWWVYAFKLFKLFLPSSSNGNVQLKGVRAALCCNLHWDLFLWSFHLIAFIYLLIHVVNGGLWWCNHR